MRHTPVVLAMCLALAAPASGQVLVDSVPIVALADTGSSTDGLAILDSLQHDSTARRLLFGALRGRYKHNDYGWHAIPEPSLGPVLNAIAADPAVSVTDAWDALQFLHVWEARRDRVKLRSLLSRARDDGDTGAVSNMGVAADRWLGQQLGDAVPRFLEMPPATFTVIPRNRKVRVLVFGDFGNLPAQRAIAADMVTYHHAHPFNLGITLGDNFYNPDGMTSPNDPRWKPLWEDVYGPMQIPFYPSLGNHDWYNGDSPAAEILHHSVSWHLPAEFYSFRAGPIEFFAIDTQIDEVSPVQLRWLAEALATSSARWKVVYGHYPLVDPRGVPDRQLASLLQVVQQGHADAYLCGHIHDLSKIPPIGDLHFLLSGGAGTDGKGFAVLVADEHKLTMTLVGQGLTERGTEVIQK